MTPRAASADARTVPSTPSGQCTAEGTEEDELHAAVQSIDAPDVVLAHSRAGRRTVVTGGTRTPTGTPRQDLRYEIGSASKTFTGLLLAELAHRQAVRLDDPAGAHLGTVAPRHRHRDAITLLHLATHTAGLPRLPWDFYPQAVPRWRTNPYAGYSADRLLAAFARSRPRHAPGRRWHYSNLGAALLGPALEGATGTPYGQLLSRLVLAPLGLDTTGLAPLGPGLAAGTDAVGHGSDGVTELPPFDAGSFVASGAVRAAPADLLGYLEAHLRPDSTPLEAALDAVQEPLLRRGLHGRPHTHGLTWLQHPTDHGTAFFHSGATMGQEAFLGFRPATGTALVALATRRYSLRTTLVHAAYRLLTELP